MDTDPVTSPSSAGDVPAGETSPSAETSPNSASSATTGAAVRNGTDATPDFDTLLQHPGFQDRLAREIQARSDRIVNAQLDRIRKDQTAAAAEQARREHLQSMRSKDPYEVGKQAQEEADRELLRDQLRAELAPALREQILAELGPQLRAEGEQAMAALIGGQLEADLDDWKSLSVDERVKLLQEHGGLGKVTAHLAKKMSEREVRKLVEGERAKWRKEYEAELRAQDRQGEPAPELGGGAPSQSDKEFLAAFASGQATDFGRAMKLLGRT